MSNEDLRMWILKLSQGNTIGPLTTHEVLKRIQEQELEGNEIVSEYPHGQPASLSSKEPFFSELLKLLEEGPDRVQAASLNKQLSKETFRESEDTVTGAQSEAMTPEDVKAQVEEYHRAIKQNEQKKILKKIDPLNSASPGAGSSPSQANTKIHLATDWTTKGLEPKKIAPLFMGMGLLMFGVFLFMLFSDQAKSKELRVQLLFPQGFRKELPSEEVKTILRSAIDKLQSDTFEGYWGAQRDLVELVEGTAENLEVRALLCVAYKELWPYAKQDAQDIKTIATLTQKTKMMNVLSPYGTMCEIVQLMTQDKLKEARNLIDHTLERQMDFSVVPVFFAYKSEIMDFEKDDINAIPYYERAIQMWESWLRPRVQLAQLFYRRQDHTRAAQILREALQLNPNHRAAKIISGLVEYSGFQKPEEAFRTLNVAMNMPGRVYPRTLAEGHATLSEIYIQRGDRAQALSHAESALEAWPAYRKAKDLISQLGGVASNQEKRASLELMYIADQYARSGDCLSAQAEYKTIFENDPQQAVAAMKAAKCLWKLNQSYEAIEWQGKAIKADPKLVSAYVAQADYLSQKYDFQKAAQVLASASRVAVNNFEVFRGLALLELRRNNVEAALNYGLRSTKLYDSDPDTYVILSQAALKLSTTVSMLTKKEVAKKEELVRSAIRYATKAVEIDPTNTEVQINYAKVLAVTGTFDAAENYLRELISKYSSNTFYRLGLAELYKEHEKYGDALLIFQQIAEIDSKSKKAFLGLGESLYALGRLKEALKPLMSAAILDPTDAEAIFLMGRLYLETNQVDFAKQNFEQVQRINPLFPRAQYYLGRAEFVLGNHKKALDHVQTEKKMNPNLADSYILAAEIYSAQKLFSECAAEYSQAIKLRPHGAEIYVRTAECYRKSGSLDVAEDMLDLASERESGFAEIYRELGQIYELKADPRAAIRAYRNYLQLSPNARDESEVRARIAALIRSG
jgi:tetratricopeptide (TPR) repeat protein